MMVNLRFIFFLSRFYYMYNFSFNAQLFPTQAHVRYLHAQFLCHVVYIEEEQIRNYVFVFALKVKLVASSILSWFTESNTL